MLNWLGGGFTTSIYLADPTVGTAARVETNADGVAADAPAVGALGGMVAMLDAQTTGAVVDTQYLAQASAASQPVVKIADESKRPVGLFSEDYNRPNFDNQRNVGGGGSYGHIGIVCNGAFVDVTVYNEDVLQATIGAPLYADAAGFISATEPGGTDKTVIGHMIKKPTTNCPVLGVKLAI